MTGSHHSPTEPRPAPALSVRGTGLGEVTIGALTAGGAALLLFVNEECPTSAMAMRRLGPLCPAWQEAGLSATAVFEDPLDIAIRIARRLGWTGRVASAGPAVRDVPRLRAGLGADRGPRRPRRDDRGHRDRLGPARPWPP